LYAAVVEITYSTTFSRWWERRREGNDSDSREGCISRTSLSIG